MEREPQPFFEELELLLPQDYTSLLQFHISNDRDKHPLDAQVVQAATRWKRLARKRRQMTCLIWFRVLSSTWTIFHWKPRLNG